jgi:Domain of Unknown Function (DUF1206)
MSFTGHGHRANKAGSLHSNRPADLSARHRGLVRIGQAGWLAKGVVYALAGLLAAVIVARSFGSTVVSGPTPEASPTGAIKEIAGFTGGRYLLVVLAVGMLIYALWRVLTALLPGAIDAESAATRIGYLVSAVLYTTFSLTAVALARHPGQRTNGNQKVTDLTATILGHSAGRFAVGVAGVIAIGAGIFRVVKGLRGDVTDELSLTGMSPQRRRWTQRLGVIGEVGRGIAIGLIGFFLVRAAVTTNTSEATGLDGALTRLSTLDWGRFVVAIVAAGFFLYGILCVATFRHRTLRTP